MNHEDGPFIHPFECTKGKYIYDVNTDAILRVSDACYERICQNDFTGNEIYRLQEQGYLKHNRVQISENPAIEMLDEYYRSELHSLTLQVTQQCNLRCEYCIYSGKYENREHRNCKMTFESAKAGIDYIFSHSEHRNRLMFGFYGGEPLLNFRLIEKAVEYIQTRNTENKLIEYYMTTNGTLLTSRVMEFLVKHDFHLTVSFDGPQCVHDKRRRYINNVGTYNDVINILRKFKKEYLRYYEQNIDVNTVIVPDEEAVKIFDYYRVEPLFEDIWAVNGTLVNDIGLKDEKICKSEVFIRTYNYEYFLVMMSKLGRINRKFISPFLEDRFLYVKELRSGKQSARSTELPKRWHHGGPCIPGEKALFLSADGYYYPCERVNETSSLARIGSISTGIDIGKVKDVINIEKYTAKECRNCWAYRYCTVCVRNICIDNHNIKDAIIESCSGIKLLVEEAFKDYSMMRSLGYDFEVGKVSASRKRI